MRSLIIFASCKYLHGQMIRCQDFLSVFTVATADCHLADDEYMFWKSVVEMNSQIEEPEEAIKLWDQSKVENVYNFCKCRLDQVSTSKLCKSLILTEIHREKLHLKKEKKLKTSFSLKKVYNFEVYYNW